MQHYAMSRGTIVLDENILEIQHFLHENNFRVIVPPSKLQDDVIIHDYLAERILLTDNAKDFMYDAIAYEYGILEIPQALIADPQRAARFIHRAFIDAKLWSRHKPFLAKMALTGRVTVRDITER